MLKPMIKPMPKTKLVIGSNDFIAMCDGKFCFNCGTIVKEYIPLYDVADVSSLPENCPANVPVCGECKKFGKKLKFNFDTPLASMKKIPVKYKGDRILSQKELDELKKIKNSKTKEVKVV